MGMTCSVILRPPEGTDLAAAAATLADELDPIIGALPWACERFHLADPWLEDGAIEIHTKVFAGSQELEQIARDTRQCAALGTLISIRRPDWAVEIADDNGLVADELGVDDITLRGGRLLTGAEVLHDLLEDLDELARHLRDEPAAAPIESMGDEDNAGEPDGSGPLWAWTADAVGPGPALAALHIEQDAPDEGSAWTRVRTTLVGPPQASWRLELRCLPLDGEGVPLGETEASLSQMEAQERREAEASGFVARGEVQGVAVFLDELHLRPLRNGEAPVRWRTDGEGDRWLRAHIPVHNDGGLARLVTRITWLDRDGDPVEVEESLQDEVVPAGDSLVFVDEPRLAWQDDDHRLSVSARVEVLAADMRRHALGVAWSNGRWSPVPGLDPVPVAPAQVSGDRAD